MLLFFIVKNLSVQSKGMKTINAQRQKKVTVKTLIVGILKDFLKREITLQLIFTGKRSDIGPWSPLLQEVVSH